MEGIEGFPGRSGLPGATTSFVGGSTFSVGGAVLGGSVVCGVGCTDAVWLFFGGTGAVLG